MPIGLHRALCVYHGAGARRQGFGRNAPWHVAHACVLTRLAREAVTARRARGDAEAGKAAARDVFKQFASVLRALNALRRHLEPHGG